MGMSVIPHLVPIPCTPPQNSQRERTRFFKNRRNGANKTKVVTEEVPLNTAQQLLTRNLGCIPMPINFLFN